MADAEEGIPAQNHDKKMEYKCPEDGAWYEVSFRYGNSGGASYFCIRYEDVDPSGEVEEVDLQNNTKVEDTIKRLRRISNQLQDWQCNTVKEGMVVCAAHRSRKGKELKYFDAVVKEVHELPDEKKNQSIDSFEVVWKKGPSKGRTTRLKVDDICLLSQESVEYHPVIQYLERALEKNNKRALDEGVLIASSNATVANDNDLKSSLESVGSNHSCKNDSLPPDSASSSLSVSGNSKFQHEIMSTYTTEDVKLHTECKKEQFNTAGKELRLNVPVKARALVPHLNLKVEHPDNPEMNPKVEDPNLKEEAPVLDPNRRVKVPNVASQNVAVKAEEETIRQ